MSSKPVRRFVAALATVCAVTAATLVGTAVPAQAVAWHAAGWHYHFDGYLSLSVETWGVKFSASGTDVDGVRTLHGVLSVGHDYCGSVRQQVGRGLVTIASGCSDAWVEIDLPPTTGGLNFSVVLSTPTHALLDGESLSVPASNADLRRAGTGVSWTSSGNATFDFEVDRPEVRLVGSVANALTRVTVARTVSTGCAVGEIGDVWAIQASTQICSSNGPIFLAQPVGRGVFVYASYIDSGGVQSPKIRLQLPQT